MRAEIHSTTSYVEEIRVALTLITREYGDLLRPLKLCVGN